MMGRSGGNGAHVDQAQLRIGVRVGHELDRSFVGIDRGLVVSKKKVGRSQGATHVRIRRKNLQGFKKQWHGISRTIVGAKKALSIVNEGLCPFESQGRRGFECTLEVPLLIVVGAA